MSDDIHDYKVDAELAILQRAYESELDQLEKSLAETEQAVVDSSMEIRRLRDLQADAKKDYRTAVADVFDIREKIAWLNDHPPTREDAELRLKQMRNEPRDLPGIEPVTVADDVALATPISSLKLPSKILDALDAHTTPIVMIGDLEKAIRNNRLASIKGIGETSIDKITDAVLEFRNNSKKGKK